jgi:hypothetical protein
MIYFQYFDYKSSNTIYYIDFTILNEGLRRWKGELVFHCQMLNDIFLCENVKTFLFHWVQYWFLLISLGNICDKEN